MKTGTLLLLVAGAALALLSAWLLLGSGGPTPETAEGPIGLSPGVVEAEEVDPTLDAVEARGDSGLSQPPSVRQSLATRGESSKQKAAIEEVREAATGPYTGRLLDPTGRPMANIEITVDSWENASRDAIGGMAFGVARREPPTTTTGTDGTFAVTSKEALGRSLGLKADVRGYSDGAVQCILDPEKGRDLGDVLMQPAVIVSGFVRDRDERPIVGARVRRVDRNGDGASDIMDQMGFGGLVKAAYTDADGWFELAHEDEGAITLEIESEDILPKLWSGPTKRAGDVLQDVIIHAERAGHIDGYVAGYPRGRRRGVVAAVPLDHVEDGAGDGLSEMLAAQLSPAGELTAPIEADGSFTLPGLVPGARYRLRAITKVRFIRTVELSDPVDARAGGERAVLQFNPGTTVTFQVLDRKTKKPVETLTVSGRYGSEPASLQLDEAAGDPPGRFPNGKVTLYELRPKSAPQRLSLTLDAPGYFRDREITVDVPASGTLNFGKVTLDPAPLLNFRIVDAATRKPIKRARVTVEPTTPPSFDFGRRRNRNRSDNEATDEEKEQQEAAEAMIFGEYRQRSRGRSDRDGRCPLSMVEADHVTLEVKARGYATFVQAPFVAPALGPDGEDPEIVIELYRGGDLQAFVTDTMEDPAADVRVEARRESGERTVKKGEMTDENGIADFENLAVGTWEVRAFRTDDSILAGPNRGGPTHEAEWVEIRVSSGTTSRVELEVPAVGDLSGVVLLGGQPSPDARVSLAEPDEVDRAERMIGFQDRFAGMNQDTTTGVTNFEGEFTLTNIIPGDYILLTRHPDLAMIVRTEVNVAAGSNSATVKIPGTALEGRVVDDAGAPIAGAAVSVERYDEEAEDALSRSAARQFLGSKKNASGTTDVDGHYRLLGVDADAELSVAVEAKGYADTRHGPVRAVMDETVPVPPISLERAGSIHVTSDSLDSTSGVSFVRATATAGRAVKLGAADKVAILKGGTARLEGLVSGTWEVTIQSTSATGPEGEPQVTTLGPEEVEVKPGEASEVEM